MIIRVDTAQNLQADICTFLKIDIIELHNIIYEMYQECIESEIYFNKNKFFNLSSKFVSAHNDEEIKEIYFCHLIRTFDCPKTLEPLYKALNTKNSLSDFLNQNDFTFTYENQKIQLYYKGQKVSESYLNSCFEDKDYYGHLSIRFGYSEKKDFCINGFLFAINPQNSTDGYYNTLKKGPEFIQNLDKLFSTNLSSKFCQLSNYYFALIKTPLDRIVFDENEDKEISNNRTKLFLFYCFQALYKIFCVNLNSGITNPIIRFRDNDSVTVEQYLPI